MRSSYVAPLRCCCARATVRVRLGRRADADRCRDLVLASCGGGGATQGLLDRGVVEDLGPDVLEALRDADGRGASYLSEQRTMDEYLAERQRLGA